jgi:hypothetical protein
MNRLVLSAASVLLVCGPAAWAQSKPWEIGVLGGFTLTTGMRAQRGALEATPSMKPGIIFGVTAGHNSYRRLGGEINYLFRMTDARLTSGATRAIFDVNVHLLTFDMPYHFADRDAKVRPYIIFGGGVKVLDGTGLERAVQPLGNIAVFAAARELLPVASVGFGVKVRTGRFGQLRFEARNFMSPSPGEVIAPMPGGKITGVWHDFTMLGGYSFRF